eukprot:GGOE01034716.1.p6 GENE.GGOE01034716.1~~GGOE01034716.1.p6  ORF type:complete len:138 (-),score=9.88 GGOE01034716.1:864-1277(-)
MPTVGEVQNLVTGTGGPCEVPKHQGPWQGWHEGARNKRGGSHVNEGIKQVAAGVVVEAVCEVWCVHRASCMCVSVCLRARVWRGGVLCVVLCCVWQGPAIEDPNAIFTADARCLARKAVAGAVDSWLAAKLRQATAM